jgi:hypothetical protein
MSSDLKTELAYLIGTHLYSFRPGEPARIVGVSIVTPPPTMAASSTDVFVGDPLPCFEREFLDGKHDFVPVYYPGGVANFDIRIVTAAEARRLYREVSEHVVA